MSIHSFIEYLKYTWKAKGRHGTHSPFVYDFVEHVLLDKDYVKKEYLVKCPWLALKYENLICRIRAYYNYNEVLCLPAVNKSNIAIDMLLLDEASPGQWVNSLDEYLPLLKNNSVVVVSGIHQNPVNSKLWKALVAHSRVRLSMDLYGIGLLFFKEEFKEKQHFTLKY